MGWRDDVSAMAWSDLPYLPENGGLALPWFRGGELLQLEPPDMAWLVHDLIPAETINLLVGSPGIGKSLLALDLALCVASGRPFVGRDTRPGKVMYVAAEDGWRRVSRRLRQWAEAHGLPLEDADCLYVLPSGLQIAAGEAYSDQADAFLEAWDQLQRDIREVAPVLVVLDPLVDIHAGLDENKSSEMAPLLRALRTLVRGKDRAIIITHHDKKGILEPSVYSGRGSGALAGGVDGIYHAVAPADERDEDLALLLHVTKGRDLPPKLKHPLGLRMRDFHWYPDASVKPSRESKALEQLREWHAWLGAQSYPVTIREAADAMDVTFKTADRTLRRLADRGWAVMSGAHPVRFSPNPGASVYGGGTDNGS